MKLNKKYALSANEGSSALAKRDIIQPQHLMVKPGLLLII